MTSSRVLYCCCLADRLPRFNLTHAKLVPVLADAVNQDEKTKEKFRNDGWIMDDCGDNISAVNDIWGDLTVLYWAWKNATDDMLGVCQYRRTWNDQELANVDPGFLYVPRSMFFPEGSVRAQYERWHNVFPAYDLSLALAQRKQIPLSAEMLKYSWNQGRFYACNMAHGPKDLFDKFCEVVFATMVPFYDEYYELCHSLSGYQRRSIAFTAERMITAIILNADYFIGPGLVREGAVELVE